MKRLISIALSFFLITSAQVKAQIEDVRLPDGSIIKVDKGLFPDYESFITPKGTAPAEYTARRKARREGRAKAIELPPYVYNNDSKYFPPYFNQDGGSCGSAQAIGYMFTHEMSVYRDVDASRPENQYPSHFTWLQAYQSTSTEDMAREMGIPNAVTYGGRTYSRLFGGQDCFDPDYGWMQGYEKWHSAMYNRISRNFSLSDPMTPEGRQELKEWLYNHGGDESLKCGGVCGVGVAAYGTWDKIPASAANNESGFTGMKYVKAWGDALNHAITIAGYDDRVEFDLDGDGIVGEVDEDEVGAWIIVNSWGNWENGGWIYCPYKYSCPVKTNEGHWSPGCYDVRRDFRPLRTIKVLMEYSRRSELLLQGGITANIKANKPERVVNFQHFRNGGNARNVSPAPEVPMLGKWADGMHYEPMEFGYDLTDLTEGYDRTQPLKYFFIIKSTSSAIGTGTIHAATFINYEADGEGIEIPFSSSEVKIQNNGAETVISVIVPGEQYYPVTNLELTDGVLAWAKPQPSSLRLIGYHIYDGSTLIATLPAEKLFFTPSDDTAGPYTVRACYQSGEFEQESEPSNSVTSEVYKPDGNCVFVMNQSGMNIPNAVPTPLGEATIEFWIRSDRNANYLQQIGPGWGQFLFHTTSSGAISVGWDSSSGNRIQTSTLLTAKKWMHVAIVIEDNVLTLYVNGMKRSSITSTKYRGLPKMSNLQIGHSGSDAWWEGAIDELRIWKKARSAKDIKSSMRMPIARPAMQQDLLLYMTMDPIEVNGKTLIREWVRGQHGTPHRTGSCSVEQDETPFSGSQLSATLAITQNATSHTADMPVVLTAQAPVSAVDWTWSAPDAQPASSKSATPTFFFAEPGQYPVSCSVLLASGEELQAETKVVVEEAEAPLADFDVASTELPAGDRFHFINRSTGQGNTYHWSLPGAEEEEVDATNATALYPSVGSFRVTLTATNSHGSSSITKEVQVKASAPAARFDVSDMAIMLGDTIHLTDQSRYDPTSWRWELSNGSRVLITDTSDPYLVPTSPGVYDISLTASNSLGKHTTTQGRILTVSNDDAVSGLNFTGSESLKLQSPLPVDTKYATLEWWMRPQEFEGCVNITTESGGLSLFSDSSGRLTVKQDAKICQSAEDYLILNEWHHYAITYSMGSVKFFRDGTLVNTATGRLGLRLPDLGTITVGADGHSLRGQIDEVRIWNKVLTAEQQCQLCNQHIADVAAAETENGLLLYYDFNQNSGNVIDRTSGAHHAERIGFGPDGDAWNSAIGVFTLDPASGRSGDVAPLYLTNYQNPFTTTTGTVNNTNSTRFLKLAMGTTKSTWKQANQIVRGSITTGAHIDKDHKSDITFETQWSGFADPLLDYHLWQTATLPAGRYTFGIQFGDGRACQKSRLVVCRGKNMVADADCEQDALAWCWMSEEELTFELLEETEVSLGIIVNLEGQQSFNIHAFRLTGLMYDFIQPVFPTGIIAPTATTHPTVSGQTYDLSGRRIKGTPERGIYIRDGRKKIIR